MIITVDEIKEIKNNKTYKGQLDINISINELDFCYFIVENREILLQLDIENRKKLIKILEDIK